MDSFTAERSCKSCMYRVENICHRYPPRAGEWSIVQETDWCGEYSEVREPTIVAPHLLEYFAEAIIEQTNASVSAERVYQHYLAWCQSRGETPKLVAPFSRMIGVRFPHMYRFQGRTTREKRQTYYKGITLRENSKIEKTNFEIEVSKFTP